MLQINASYKPAYIYGGPTMSVSKLSETLVKAGCIIEVFTTTANGKTELAETGKDAAIVDTVPVYYYKRLTKDHSHFSPQLLKAVWKRATQFDVVHIHAWWNLVSVLSCLLAVMRGVPVVLSPRGTLSNYSFYNKNSFLKKCIHVFLGKPLLSRCYIHATSQHEQAAMAKLVQTRQIFNIPNFIELSAIAVNKPNNNGPLKLLFLSRIEEKKGLDILLHALADITVTYHLTIAGDGDPNYINTLNQITIQNNTSDNVSWIGFQSDDKFNIMAAHDILILPSYDENFGNVVIENLSTGTAVLISNQVGLANYVSEHNLGWICQTNAASVAEKINNIDRESLERIKASAPALIAAHFNGDNLVKQYTNMYQIITHG
jgi:glycosyltransferase involved in cell wall biosynthesis